MDNSFPIILIHKKDIKKGSLKELTLLELTKEVTRLFREECKRCDVKYWAESAADFQLEDDEDIEDEYATNAALGYSFGEEGSKTPIRIRLTFSVKKIVIRTPKPVAVRVTGIGADTVEFEWGLAAHKLDRTQLSSLSFEITQISPYTLAVTECNPTVGSNERYQTKLSGLQPATNYKFLIRSVLQHQNNNIHSETCKVFAVATKSCEYVAAWFGLELGPFSVIPQMVNVAPQNNNNYPPWGRGVNNNTNAFSWGTNNNYRQHLRNNNSADVPCYNYPNRLALSETKCDDEKMNDDDRNEEEMRSEVTWEWQQNDDEWIPYNYEVSKELEKLEIGQSYIYQCYEKWKEYKIKKHSKEFVLQINTDSKVCRLGRRTVAKIKKKKNVREEEPFGMQIEYPSWWSIDCQQISNYGTPKLIGLDCETNITAKQIYHKFHETVRNKKIVTIVSVENQLLFDKYWGEKQRLLKLAQNNVNKINERYLFHGTRTEDAMELIKKEGFRKEFNRTSQFGQGTYFARDAKYSLHYAATDGNGISKIFCCAVICGESTKGDRHYKLKTWPKKSDGFMYDTLVDSIYDPKIYVIHENARAYPSFVIYYCDWNEYV